MAHSSARETSLSSSARDPSLPRPLSPFLSHPLPVFLCLPPPRLSLSLSRVLSGTLSSSLICESWRVLVSVCASTRVVGDDRCRCRSRARAFGSGSVTQKWGVQGMVRVVVGMDDLTLDVPSAHAELLALLHLMQQVTCLASQHLLHLASYATRPTRHSDLPFSPPSLLSPPCLTPSFHPTPPSPPPISPSSLYRFLASPSFHSPSPTPPIPCLLPVGRM